MLVVKSVNDCSKKCSKSQVEEKAKEDEKHFKFYSEEGPRYWKRTFWSLLDPLVSPSSSIAKRLEGDCPFWPC